ncbi:Permease of the drug/metabolite transporter (DMT) superfamily [Salmonella enterica subsp. enterica]|uniref:Permease of the drug/metabolite transporter (DMT) superfamily n=1 Tax=Salmonella enterica I TaxID=59201 RepID=A0A379WJW0_SALET|nr:Permease of the drug/metabolite transporter (DMT) superfamily [Salmonella enterica subsp. enterica]
MIRYVADVQPVFERRATDWWPQSQHLSCAEPLSSALLSLLLLGISFTLPDWLGTLLILSSVILISLDSRRRARPLNALIITMTGRKREKFNGALP